MNKSNENKNRLISAGVTVIFHVIVVIMLFVFGLPYKNPPPAEIGVEMSTDDLTDAPEGIAGITGGGETTEAPSVTANNDQEYAVSQNTEKVSVTAKNSRPKPKTEPKNKTPEVDENALFSKGKVNKGGSGNGEGGGNGDKQGSGNGNNSFGEGTGTNGTSFSLNGRGAKSLSVPKTNRTETGKIVVEIKVDKDGNVVEAHGGAKGTTIMNTNIWRTCEQAAKKSKFTPKEDAPELQKGTITYKFVR